MRPSDLDDVCSVVGYTATRVLAAWFGGTNVMVPRQALDEHPLSLLLGASAYRALVREFAGHVISVPKADDEWRYYRDRVIAERFADGATPAQIAIEMNLTPRRVEQLRTDLVERGWLRYASGYQGPARRGPGT